LFIPLHWALALHFQADVSALIPLFFKANCINCRWLQPTDSDCLYIFWALAQYSSLLIIHPLNKRKIERAKALEGIIAFRSAIELPLPALFIPLHWALALHFHAKCLSSSPALFQAKCLSFISLIFQATYLNCHWLLCISNHNA
jgi:hypothetical protein